MRFEVREKHALRQREQDEVTVHRTYPSERDVKPMAIASPCATAAEMVKTIAGLSCAASLLYLNSNPAAAIDKGKETSPQSATAG